VSALQIISPAQDTVGVGQSSLPTFSRLGVVLVDDPDSSKSAQLLDVVRPSERGAIQLLLPRDVFVFSERMGSLESLFASEANPSTLALPASATAPARNIDAEGRFRTAFQRSAEERFEDGMESEFSKELELLVKAYGPSSKDILSRLLEDDSVSAKAWGEAMRWLGRFDDRASHEARLWVLEKGLTAHSAFVRDGAALGLASMDDPSAIPYLQRAIDSEKVGGLREDLQEVLSQLTGR
jgi:hypothetical protein